MNACRNALCLLLGVLGMTVCAAGFVYGQTTSKGFALEISSPSIGTETKVKWLAKPMRSWYAACMPHEGKPAEKICEISGRIKGAGSDHVVDIFITTNKEWPQAQNVDLSKQGEFKGLVFIHKTKPKMVIRFALSKVDDDGNKKHVHDFSILVK